MLKNCGHDPTRGFLGLIKKVILIIIFKIIINIFIYISQNLKRQTLLLSIPLTNLVKEKVAVIQFYQNQAYYKKKIKI